MEHEIIGNLSMPLVLVAIITPSLVQLIIKIIDNIYMSKKDIITEDMRDNFVEMKVSFVEMKSDIKSIVKTLDDVQQEQQTFKREQYDLRSHIHQVELKQNAKN